MSNVSNFNIKIAVDSKTGQVSVESLAKSVKKAGEEMKSSFSGAKIAVAAFSVALIAGARDAVKAFQVQRDAVRNVEATIKSTGGAAGVTSQELQNMAASLQKVTNFGDEATLKGQAMLLTFTKIGKDVFPQATETMLNMAEKFGSVDQAAVQLGKALNDPIMGVTALRRVGIQLTAEQEKQIKKFMDMGDVASAQKVILGELETQFGGLAKSMADPMKQLMNIIGDVKEQFGGIIMTVLTPLLPVIESIAKVFSEVADALAPVISQLAEALAPAIKLLLPPLTTLVQGIFKALSPILDVIVRSMTKFVPIIAKLVTAAGKLVEAMEPMINMFAKLAEDQLDQLIELLDAVLTLFIALSPAITLVAQVTASLIGTGLAFMNAVVTPVIDAIKYIIEKGAEAADWIASIFGGGSRKKPKQTKQQDQAVTPDGTPITPGLGAPAPAASGKAALVPGSIPYMEAQLKKLEELRGKTIAGSDAWARYTLMIAKAQAELDIFKRIAEDLTGTGPAAKGLSPFEKLAKDIELLPTVVDPAIDATTSLAENLADSFDNVAMVAGNVTGALANIFSENFEVMKGLAVAETIISTSAAIMRTLRDGGAWALPIALSVGALGATQIAKILATKPGSSGGGSQSISGLAQSGSAPVGGNAAPRRLSLSGSSGSMPTEIKLRAEGADLVGVMNVNTRNMELAGV